MQTRSEGVLIANLRRAKKPRRSPISLIRALNLIFPGTAPGGNLKNGSTVLTQDTTLRGELLGKRVARAQTRAWLEREFGPEFGTNRQGLKPSLQIEFKAGRPLPNTSLKWNPITGGTTDPLQIEVATIRYMNTKIPDWGNNRSPNNDYVAGSTRSRGFRTPFKTVYFDHLTGDSRFPTANEAFTGYAPSPRDIEAWVSLSKQRRVVPGMIINFQNGQRQSVSLRNAVSLIAAGYQVSVVPYIWWHQHVNESES